MSRRVRTLFADADAELLWSAASTWELAIKTQLGRLRLAEPVGTFVMRMLCEQNLTPLPVHHAHAALVAELPLVHRDPFDRLLVAQATSEAVPLVTADRSLRAYGVRCIWA